ncbi:hypothetical protein Bind_2641 [Beijerinckia indica subsp. indica ATCC 9039]|uniref:Uncharacterized protein n=1 Tax=Beijerinckia indica subsp. indica (strain ATCC 9039 / DSM 1715 / NCIMB 8712) TaxID=395963 RepID=B2IJA4_BEII9|nr:hypothetical protein Bind_2641 [Beijerinckia indica subsp. indica ATCC 9039]
MALLQTLVYDVSRESYDFVFPISDAVVCRQCHYQEAEPLVQGAMQKLTFNGSQSIQFVFVYMYYRVFPIDRSCLQMVVFVRY